MFEQLIDFKRILGYIVGGIGLLLIFAEAWVTKLSQIAFSVGTLKISILSIILLITAFFMIIDNKKLNK